MFCKNCGERMIGDGFTAVYHCPDADSTGFEPDAGPINCEDLQEFITLEQYINFLTSLAEKHPELLKLPVYADNPDSLYITPVSIDNIGIAYLDEEDDPETPVPLNSDDVTPLSIAVFCVT